MEVVRLRFLNWEKWNKRSKDIAHPQWYSMTNRPYEDDAWHELDPFEYRAFVALLGYASQSNKNGEFKFTVKRWERQTGIDPNTLFEAIEKLEVLEILKRDGTRPQHDHATAVPRSASGRDTAAPRSLQDKTRQDKTEHSAVENGGVSCGQSDALEQDPAPPKDPDPSDELQAVGGEIEDPIKTPKGQEHLSAPVIAVAGPQCLQEHSVTDPEPAPPQTPKPEPPPSPGPLPLRAARTADSDLSRDAHPAQDAAPSGVTTDAQGPEDSAASGPAQSGEEAAWRVFDELWSEYRVRLKGRKILEWDDKRKRAARSRWREHPSRDYWRWTLSRAAGSKFVRGEIRPPPDRKPFVANIDWFLRPGTCVKINEGFYDGSQKGIVPSVDELD